jgi:hypothetical protein
MQRKKKSDEKQPMKIQSTALKTRKTVEMDHVRRRLSSSSNNVSNMRLDGAMGIPLQVQVSTCQKEQSVFHLSEPSAALAKLLGDGQTVI